MKKTSVSLSDNILDGAREKVKALKADDERMSLSRYFEDLVREDLRKEEAGEDDLEKGEEAA